MSAFIIPHCLRLLEELHRDHPGVTWIKSVACSYMWWPGLDKELELLSGDPRISVMGVLK